MAFSVSPMTHKITLKPGEIYRGKILVANPLTATNDFYYKASLHPYSVNNDTNKLDFQTMTGWSEMVNWITLENETGVLKPNDTSEILFTITVPDNPLAGGQYAMIAVAQDTEKTGEAVDSSVKSIYEMASLIYAEVEGETTHACEILENSVPNFVFEGVPQTVVKLANRGNVHESGKTFLTIKNLATGEIVNYTKNYEDGVETLVMPDSERTVVRDLEGLSKLGIFEVVQEVKCLDDYSHNSTIMVICPIWLIGLICLLLLVVIGAIVWRIRLRHKKV